jgi:hypothetical protein
MQLARPTGDRAEKHSVTRILRERYRHLTRQMQARVDGREWAQSPIRKMIVDNHQAEAPRKARPPFIEPVRLRAAFDIGGGAVIWFAAWNPGRNLAIAIDISSGEVEFCEQSLRSARRVRGDHFAGPFPSQQQAEVETKMCSYEPCAEWICKRAENLKVLGYKVELKENSLQSRSILLEAANELWNQNWWSGTLETQA